jgi:hypothetical protein
MEGGSHESPYGHTLRIKPSNEGGKKNDEYSLYCRTGALRPNDMAFNVKVVFFKNMKKEFSSPRFMCAPVHIYIFSQKRERKKINVHRGTHETW